MQLSQRNINEFFIHLKRSILFWTIAIVLFSIFRYYGLEDELDFTLQKEIFVTYNIRNFFWGYICIGVIVGILYGTIEFILDKYIFKYLPIAVVILIYTTLVLAAVIGTSELVLRYFSTFLDIPVDVGRGWWYKDKSFIAHILFIPTASYIFSLIVIISDNFGSGVFIKMLIGYYKVPKQENRIFMFLDLKDSTSIAEQIGHISFSHLLQDCFYDLNELVPACKAEIYQYVGDEAVMSWKTKNGVVNANCINLHFLFAKRLQQRSQYYRDKYGLVPEFKAGVHHGMITAAEVGLIKKSLAYHGDVVNTTARILNECKKRQLSIVISKNLLDILDLSDQFSSAYIDTAILKGKDKKVKIYTVSALKQN